jgi:hypothetical protein
LRGAHEALGYERARVRRGFVAHASLAGTRTDDVAKDPPECPEAFPACFECDVDDRTIRIAKQCRRTLDSARQKIAVRRDAERFFERTCEMCGGDTANAREARYRPRLIGRGVDRILRAQQAAD